MEIINTYINTLNCNLLFDHRFSTTLPVCRRREVQVSQVIVPDTVESHNCLHKKSSLSQVVCFDVNIHSHFCLGCVFMSRRRFQLLFVCVFVIVELICICKTLKIPISCKCVQFKVSNIRIPTQFDHWTHFLDPAKGHFCIQR